MEHKLEIQKVCECCKKIFIAQRTTTRYCSHACNRRAYKKNKRKEKFASSYPEDYYLDRQKLPSKEELQKQEFFTVAEAAKLLGICRQTIYNLIYSGKLKAAQITNRLCIIRRKDIDGMCDYAGSYRAKPVRTQEPITEFYTVEDIKTKFNIKESWIFKIAKENNIPKTLKRGKTYFAKKPFDSYFAKKGFFENEKISEWYSVEDIQSKYSLSTNAIYSFVSEHNIPRKKDGLKVFYSKKDFDIAKGYEKPAEPEYYTSAEAMIKYNLTQDALYHYVRAYNIPKIKDGRYIKISKLELDKLFENKIIR